MVFVHRNEKIEVRSFSSFSKFGQQAIIFFTCSKQCIIAWALEDYKQPCVI